jgi:hypothetical protein
VALKTDAALLSGVSRKIDSDSATAAAYSIRDSAEDDRRIDVTPWQV